MNTAVDSSVFIFFSKLGCLGLLPSLFARLHVSGVVVREVLAGKGENREDAGNFEEFLRSGVLNIAKSRPEPSLGEDATISLALEIGAEVVLMDDRAGIMKAKLSGLNAYSCPFLLLLALKRKLISKGEFDRLLDSLLSFNYFISPGLLREIIAASEKLS